MAEQPRSAKQQGGYFGKFIASAERLYAKSKSSDVQHTDVSVFKAASMIAVLAPTLAVGTWSRILHLSVLTSWTVRMLHF